LQKIKQFFRVTSLLIMTIVSGVAAAIMTAFAAIGADNVGPETKNDYNSLCKYFKNCHTNT
jgi:hypothetical protein